MDFALVDRRIDMVRTPVSCAARATSYDDPEIGDAASRIFRLPAKLVLFDANRRGRYSRFGGFWGERMQWVPLTSALGARIVVEELERRGIAPEPILDAAGLERADVAADRPRIANDKNTALFELAAAASGDDFFGLFVGGLSDPRDLGAVSYLMLASDTLGDALDQLRRYLGLISEVDTIDLSCDAARAVVTAIPAQPGTPAGQQSAGRQSAESGSLFFVRFLQHLVEPGLAPLEVRFVHGFDGQPDAHIRAFGCPVRFRHSHNQVVFRRSDLSKPVTSADNRLFRILKSLCDALLAQSAAGIPPLVASVRGHIAKLLPKQRAKAKIVASEMGMSERTLTRRLSAHGTSFSEIRDTMRRDLATEYLRESDQSLTQIAFLLDYSSQSAFSSAFKRMTGRTPRDVRREVG